MIILNFVSKKKLLYSRKLDVKNEFSMKIIDFNSAETFRFDDFSSCHWLNRTEIIIVSVSKSYNILNIFLFWCLNLVLWTTWIIFVTLTCIYPGYFTEGANERHRDHCGNLHFACCCCLQSICCYCLLFALWNGIKNKSFSTFYQRVANVFNFHLFLKFLKKFNEFDRNCSKLVFNFK